MGRSQWMIRCIEIAHLKQWSTLALLLTELQACAGNLYVSGFVHLFVQSPQSHRALPVHLKAVATAVSFREAHSIYSAARVEILFQVSGTAFSNI